MDMSINSIRSRQSNASTIDANRQMKHLLGKAYNPALSASENFVAAGLAAKSNQNSSFHTMEAKIVLDTISVPPGKILVVHNGINLQTTVKSGVLEFHHGEVNASGNAKVIVKGTGWGYATSPNSTVLAGSDQAHVEKTQDGAIALGYEEAKPVIAQLKKEIKNYALTHAPHDVDEGDVSPDSDDVRSEDYIYDGSVSLSSDSENGSASETTDSSSETSSDSTWSSSSSATTSSSGKTTSDASWSNSSSGATTSSGKTTSDSTWSSSSTYTSSSGDTSSDSDWYSISNATTSSNTASSDNIKKPSSQPLKKDVEELGDVSPDPDDVKTEIYIALGTGTLSSDSDSDSTTDSSIGTSSDSNTASSPTSSDNTKKAPK